MQEAADGDTPKSACCIPQPMPDGAWPVGPAPHRRAGLRVLLVRTCTPDLPLAPAKPATTKRA